MPNYFIKRIETTHGYRKVFRKLPKNLQQKTLIRTALFQKNPFDRRLKTHQLKGKLKDRWSFSVTYSHRILFKFLNKNTTIFYDIGPHDIYR